MLTDEDKLIQQARELNAAKEYKQVYDLLPWELIKQSNNGDLFYEAGVAAENIRQFKDAALFYWHARYSGQHISEAHAGRARIMILAGRYEKAVEQFDIAIKSEPSNSEYYLCRGYAYSNLEDSFDEAISDLTKSIELNPHYAEAFQVRAAILFGNKKYDEAFQDINQVIALQPDANDAYNIRGLLCHYKDDYDKALSDFDIAISLQPNEPDPWYNKGAVWTKKEEYAKAIECFSRAIGLNPRSENSYIARADCRQKLEAFDEAIADYASAVKVNYDLEYPWLRMAQIFNDRPKYHEAGSQYPVDINMKTVPGACFAMGFVSYHLKDYYDARALFERAIWSGYEEDTSLAKSWKEKAEARINEAPGNQGPRQQKREQAAAFLEQIRKEYALKFQKSTDGFVNNGKISKWSNKQAVEAGIEGWLPAIRPDIAKWDFHRYPYGASELMVFAHNGKHFSPYEAGIPMTYTMWEEISKGPHDLGGEFIGRVKKFDKIGRVLDEYIESIRLGRADKGIIFEQDEVDEETAMLKSIMFF